MHLAKCPLCQIPHCFRPKDAAHGMKNIFASTDIFAISCSKILKCGLDEITRLFGKMSSELCLYQGRLLPLMRNHGDVLSETEVLLVTKFTAFAIKFADHMYQETDHGMKYYELYRLSWWLKNCGGDHDSLPVDQILECATSFEGFRSLLFGVCSNVFVSIAETVNLQAQPFYTDLEMVYTAVRHE